MKRNKILCDDGGVISFLILSKYGKFSVLIDSADRDVLDRCWHISTKRGKLEKVVAKLNKKTVTLAFIISGLKPVDHVNGDVLDNRRCNLRGCTQKQNARNRKANINSFTGLKGVYRDKKNYRAAITVDYKYKYLGNFNDAISAARAYNEAAIKYFGEYARLNKI